MKVCLLGLSQQLNNRKSEVQFRTVSTEGKGPDMIGRELHVQEGELTRCSRLGVMSLRVRDLTGQDRVEPGRRTYRFRAGLSATGES